MPPGPAGTKTDQVFPTGSPTPKFMHVYTQGTESSTDMAQGSHK